MWYYKTEEGAVLFSTDFIPDYEVISEKEYNQILESIYVPPSEEEIRAQKEEELRRLLQELYPPEEDTSNES